ncbi:MAG: histidine kinase [Bacteroidota bacterium]
MYRKVYNNLPIPFGWLLVFMLLLAVLITLQQYIAYVIGNYEQEFNGLAVFVRYTILFSFLSLLTPFMAFSARVFVENRKPRFFTVHFGLSILIAILHRILTGVGHNMMYIVFYSDIESFELFSDWVVASFFAGLISSLIFYWLGVGLFIAAINQTKLINQERELANARVHALMTQLRPHFLFNTLNSISALIDLDTLAAQKVISRFADLLRGVLDKEGRHFITLDEELKFIENYLSIELERYREQLSVSYDIDPDALKGQVPSLILQPLVENAIKHGTSRLLENGQINIRAEVLNESKSTLLLQVVDNGRGLVENYKYGLGLNNVSNRLKELYGDDFEFKLEQGIESGCVASIVIPLHL